MDGRLFVFVLMAVAVRARTAMNVNKRDVGSPGHAVSYAHVIRDHGTPVPYNVGKGYHSHGAPIGLSQYHSSFTKQAYPSPAQTYIPYSVSEADPVSHQYAVPVPATAQQPYSHPYSAPANSGYRGNTYETYEPQSEEQDEADYSASAEEYD